MYFTYDEGMYVFPNFFIDSLSTSCVRIPIDKIMLESYALKD